MKANTVYVESLWAAPEHETFEAAAAGSGPRRRQPRADRDNATLKTDSIVGHSTTEETLHLILKSGRILELFLGTQCVDWRIAASVEAGRTRSQAPAMSLRFPSGRVYDWQPEELLVRLEGHVGVAIAPSDTWLFLYVRGCADVMLSGFSVERGRRRLLFYSLK